MAFQLLKNVAAKALSGVGTAASSAINYLTKNAPEVIDNTLNQAANAVNRGKFGAQNSNITQAPVRQPLENLFKSTFIGKGLRGDIDLTTPESQLDLVSNFTGAAGITKPIPNATKTIFKEATKKGTKVVNKTKDLFSKAPLAQDVNLYDKVVLPRTQRLEKSLPTEIFGSLKKNTIDPLNESLGEGSEWVNSYYNRVKNLNIAPGSREDSLIRALTKGDTNIDDLTSELGEESATKIARASTDLRQMYDEIFELVNTKRKASGLKEIAYKKDFLSQVGSKGGNVLDDIVQGGVSQGKSSSLFKSQTAKAKTGAIESFMDYIQSAKQAGFVDPNVPSLTKFTEDLSKAGADSKVVDYLKDYEKTLLGEKEYGGVMGAIDKVTGKMRGSAVLGNPSTLLAQTFNIPQAVNEAGLKNFIKGFGGEANTAVQKSPYIKTLSEKVPTALVKGTGKKIVHGMGSLIQTANENVAKTIWKGFYQQGKSKGVTDPITYADDLAVQLMGDRRLGAGSQFYSSPVGKIFGAFTLENQAGINRLVKSIGEKKAGTVIGTLVTWHLANNANERLGSGYRPFLDPIQAGKDITEQYFGSDKKDPNTLKAIGRFVGEATKLSPALQSSIYTLYKGGEALGALPESQDVFGTEDPTWMNSGNLYNPLQNVGRNITGNDFIDEPLNVASKFVPGVNPVSKMIQAGVSQSKGFVESRNGRAMFETPKNIFDKARSFAFGQYSTPEAQEYFDNDFSRSLSEDETAVVKNLPKEARGEAVSSLRKQNAQEQRLKPTEDEGLFGSLFNKKEAVDWDTKPKTKTEKQAFDKQVDIAIEAGAEVPDNAIITRFFDGKTYDKSARKGQQDILNEMLKVADDEYLTPEQKAKIANAAKIEPADLQYYRTASMDQDARLEGLLEYAGTADPEKRDEFMENLILGKKEVGGKSMFSTAMYDRLYDEGLITKDEKALITAMKYDPIFNKFYMDRDFKGSGGGLTASKAKSLVSSVNSLFKKTIKSTSDVDKQIAELSKAPETPKPRFSKARRSGSRPTSSWFTQY